MFELMERDCPISEFDGRLFMAVVDTITVNEQGKLLFSFVIETEQKPYFDKKY